MSSEKGFKIMITKSAQEGSWKGVFLTEVKHVVQIAKENKNGNYFNHLGNKVVFYS